MSAINHAAGFHAIAAVHPGNAALGSIFNECRAMRRISYISKALIGHDESVLDDIVVPATRHNARCDITGLLLFDGKRFIQAIEGEDVAIDACFRRIKTDRKHCEINVFESAQIDKREFGEWSLLMRNALDLTVKEYKEQVAHDVAGVDSMATKAMFIGFAALGHR